MSGRDTGLVNDSSTNEMEEQDSTQIYLRMISSKSYETTYFENESHKLHQTLSWLGSGQPLEIYRGAICQRSDRDDSIIMILIVMCTINQFFGSHCP